MRKLYILGNPYTDNLTVLHDHVFHDRCLEGVANGFLCGIELTVCAQPPNLEQSPIQFVVHYKQ